MKRCFVMAMVLAGCGGTNGTGGAADSGSGVDADAGQTVSNDAAGGTDAAGESDSDTSPNADATPGADAAGDGAAAVPAKCQAWADHVVAACSTASSSSTIAQCLQGERTYPPEGCGTEWDAYVTCATQATYACGGGTTGCDSQQNAYIQCQSSFASTTGCTRIGKDSVCSSSTPPYAFACTAALPSGCKQVPTSSAATIACCPAFSPH